MVFSENGTDVSGTSRMINMAPRHLAFCVLVLGFGSLALRADPAKPSEEETIRLKPYVIEEKSLANTGFSFKAKFRHHMLWAGIKELIITQVESRSYAKKAGLEVGEKIIQIRDVKVEGLGLKELQREFETKSVNGKITLLIQAKDSNTTRTVELQFNEPPPQEKKAPNQPE
jgi:predicted metalloprotease with PDZ domain